MVQKVLLRSKSVLTVSFFCIVPFCGCTNGQQQSVLKLKNYSLDQSVVPDDTILVTDVRLTLVKRRYWNNNTPYSGIVKETYANGMVKKYISVYHGMRHGVSISYYENGMPWEIRNYKNNLSTGKHYGYWAESGFPKFEYNYYEEKMEGVQKKWYPSGKPFLFLNYSNDQEAGLQQGWRENGKLFLNYEAKDGFRYGLQKAALCYTLKDEKLK